MPELVLNLPDRAGITSIIQMLLHPLQGFRSRLPIMNVELVRDYPMPLRCSERNVQLTSSEMLVIHHGLSSWGILNGDWTVYAVAM